MTTLGRCFGYTIYKNPSDIPGHYVMRGWNIEGGKNVHSREAVALPINDESLALLRKVLWEKGMICLGRRPEDDPVIVETWI